MTENNNRGVLVRTTSVSIVAIFILAGCASTPKGNITYFFPKAVTNLVATQSISCNEKSSSLQQVLSVVPTTTYLSDSFKSHTIEPSALGGYGADADLTLTFTDDGRLSSVNSVTTGQGQAILKDVLSVAKVAVAVSVTGGTYDVGAACKYIAENGTKVKDGPAALTLKFTAEFEFGSTNETSLGIRESGNGTFTNDITFRVDPASEALYRGLAAHIPKLGFSVSVEEKVTPLDAPVWAGASRSSYPLKLNRVGIAQLKVTGPKGDLASADTVWTGLVSVPLTRGENDYFFVPIPKAQLFGKQTFALTLSPVGSITKLQYAKTGSTEASGAASQLAGLIGELGKDATTAEQAAKLQAEADLIYQQQRLALCRANPSACVAK